MKNKNQTYQGLSTLEVLEGADNYNRWIADTVKQYAQSPILEVGAGIGNISDYFKNEKNMYITERDRELLKRLRNRFGKQRNITIKQLDVSKRNAMLEGKFATVFAVNVLEHIENDVKALSHMNLL